VGGASPQAWRACERRRGGVVFDAELSGGFFTTSFATLKVFCGG
jgi:hypothetical protein